GTRFLYYFCLCKSFKELLLHADRPDFWAKADAKVRKIQIQTKLLTKKIIKQRKVFGIVDKIPLDDPSKEEGLCKKLCKILLLLFNNIAKNYSLRPKILNK
ncbi:MAG: hypothetical protein IJJ56_06840, partial [Prevotella sp.]|nr:hypothetical protein [Prevotella sp.]